MRRSSQAVQAMLLLLPVLLLLLLPAACQQTMPFPGNGEEPDEPVTVFVSSYVDRLMEIDDKAYEFQALVFVYLSWTDPRARQTVAANRAKLAANSSATCKLSCQLYPQGEPNPRNGCCDDVWLPYVSFPNLKLLSQDRVLRSGVNIEPDSDAVGYWSIILGTFMASLDLRAFPFDAQRLHVQMEIPGWAGGNVRLQPSSSGTRMFNSNPDGDALSGWQVVSVRMATYALPLCQRYTASSSRPSAADDPAPLVSELLFTDKSIAARPASCAAVLDANRDDPAFLAYTRQNLDGGRELYDRPLNVTGVTCTVVIRRYVAQWIMSAILPIVASTWLGFVVFLLPRDCINSRLGAVMTIFVALAAIQFVVSNDLPKSSYMTALQQLIAAGYVTLILIGLESLVIFWITTYHSHGKRLAAHLEAQRHYQEELKAELATLKVRLASVLEEQERQQALNPGAFARLTSLKGLSMRRVSKSARSVRRMGSGNTACSTTSLTSLEERAAAAVLAADDSNHRRQQQAAAGMNGSMQQQQPAAAPQPQVGSAATGAAAGRDADRCAGSEVSWTGGRSDQLKATQQQVVQQVSRLEQQLAELRAKEALLRQDLQADRSATRLADRQGSITALGLGAGADHSHRQQQPAAVVGPEAAAAAGDAVLLDVGGADAGHSHEHGQEQPPTCCWHDWRLCTRIRVYLATMREDEALTDRLAFQVNTWIGSLQFLAYNIAVLLIFLVNWLLYRKY